MVDSDALLGADNNWPLPAGDAGNASTSLSSISLMGASASSCSLLNHASTCRLTALTSIGPRTRPSPSAGPSRSTRAWFPRPARACPNGHGRRRSLGSGRRPRWRRRRPLRPPVPTRNSIGTGKDSRWRDRGRRHADPRTRTARCWPCLGRLRSGVDTPRRTTPGGGELSMAPRATIRRRDVRRDDVGRRGAGLGRSCPRSAVAPPA